MNLFGLSKRVLGHFCHQLGTMLQAGLPLRRALATLERSGQTAGIKQIARRLGDEIEQGSTFTEALQRQGSLFPALMIQLIGVGEEAGSLDSVLEELGKYFELQREIQRSFLAQLAFPVLELLAAIFVLGGLACILAMLGDEGKDPTGELLRVWGIGYGSVIGAVALYYFVTRSLGGLRIVHEIILRIPILRYVHRSLALARFSWSMQLMTEAGAPIFDSIERSLRATNNGAFQARAERITRTLADGVPLPDALQAAGLFPIDYVEIMRVAVESGSMSESFARLARQHFDNAERGMRAAAVAFGVLIWVGIAGILTYFIITLAMKYWIGPIRDTLDYVN